MSKDIKGCFLHNSDDWRTPSYLYKYYIDRGYIDPCPYKSVQDNLNNIYEDKKLFINPPFSKLSEWADFVIRNLNNNDIVLLMPARTDTIYFHKLLKFNPEVVFIKGRLSFNDTGISPFPTILLVFERNLPIKLYSTVDVKKLKSL